MASSTRTFVYLVFFINLIILSNGIDDNFENNLSSKQFNPRRLLCSRLPRQRRPSCRRAFRLLAAQIQNSFITIENSTVALRHVNGSELKVQGWCTSSTFLLHQNIMLKLNSVINIPFSTNMLYESVYLNIVVPSKLSGKFSVSHRAGVSTFGRKQGCRYLYKDDFNMYGSTDTTIRMKGTFSINVSMRTTKTSYVIRIRPIVDIDYSLQSDLDITWEYSGLNNVAAYVLRRLQVYIDQQLRRTVRSAMSEYDETIKLRLKTSVEAGIRKVFRTNNNGVHIITIPRVKQINL